MTPKRKFRLASLVLCILINGVFLGALYGAIHYYVLQDLRGAVEPALGQVPQEIIPEPARRALVEMDAHLERLDALSAPAVFGVGGVATLLLWLLLQWPARRIPGEPSQPEQVSREAPADDLRREADRLRQELEAARRAASRPSPVPAVQILALLQRKGRLIDFLQEDLGAYDDSQIGAAVRSVHQGCREALSECVRLEAIMDKEEGEEVRVEAGFDPGAVRLIGDVKGNPPFKGVLRHRGWRVVRIDLPLKAPGPEREWVLAPAEVELGSS